MKLNHTFETALYVDDLEGACDFYERLLGTTSFANSPGRHVFFKLKNDMLLLFDTMVTTDPDTKLTPHGCTGSGHVAFPVEEADLPR